MKYNAFILKTSIAFFLSIAVFSPVQAQLLKKLKEKVSKTIGADDEKDKGKSEKKATDFLAYMNSIFFIGSIAVGNPNVIMDVAKEMMGKFAPLTATSASTPLERFKTGIFCDAAKAGSGTKNCRGRF